MRFQRTMPTMYTLLVLFSVVSLTRCGQAQFSGKSTREATAAAPATTPTTPNQPPVPTTPTAPGAPSNIACNKSLEISLVVDASGSMNNEKIIAVRQSANILLSSLTASDFSSLTVFNTDSKLIAPMSSNHAATIASLSSETINLPAGNTNITAGLATGYQQIVQNVSANAMKIIILLSDGEHNTGDSPVALANQIKQSGDITIITITSLRDMSFLNSLLGPSAATAQITSMFSGQGKTLMAQLASSPQFYMEAQDQANLQQAFTNIRTALCRAP